MEVETCYCCHSHIKDFKSIMPKPNTISIVKYFKLKFSVVFRRFEKQIDCKSIKGNFSLFLKTYIPKNIVSTYLLSLY